jgi:hypothetical protein
MRVGELKYEIRFGKIRSDDPGMCLNSEDVCMTGSQ